MLDLAIVDKLNRAGFVVAPYNTPEEESSVKSVSGPARSAHTTAYEASGSSGTAKQEGAAVRWRGHWGN